MLLHCVDELVEIILNSNNILTSITDGNNPLLVLLKSVYIVLEKEDEDILEDFVIVYSRILLNLCEVVTQIKCDEQFNNIAMVVT